jgi:hypothetical protein
MSCNDIFKCKLWPVLGTYLKQEQIPGGY